MRIYRRHDAHILLIFRISIMNSFDIIYYGFSLENWLRIEFCDPSDSFWQEQKKKGVSTPEIPGWQELIG